MIELRDDQARERNLIKTWKPRALLIVGVNTELAMDMGKNWI
jgi:hypothetical protein